MSKGLNRTPQAENTDFIKWSYINPNCLGYENLSVTDAAAVSLTVPANASYAVIVAEADATATTTSKIVRFREDGTSPTASEGLPLGDLGLYKCSGETNLSNIEFIGIEAGKTHSLKIHYY